MPRIHHCTAAHGVYEAWMTLAEILTLGFLFMHFGSSDVSWHRLHGVSAIPWSASCGSGATTTASTQSYVPVKYAQWRVITTPTRDTSPEPTQRSVVSGSYFSICPFVLGSASWRLDSLSSVFWNWAHHRQILLLSRFVARPLSFMIFSFLEKDVF